MYEEVLINIYAKVAKERWTLWDILKTLYAILINLDGPTLRTVIFVVLNVVNGQEFQIIQNMLQ